MFFPPELFGYIATIMSMTAFIPTVYHVYKTNKSSHLVFSTLVLFLLSQIFWFLHGYERFDYSILVSTSINIILHLYLIYKVVTY